MRKVGQSAQNRGNAGKGRVRGVPNKLTKALKDMILQALANAGGEEYLARQADENPNAFLALVGRVLPIQHHESEHEPMVPKPVIHERIS